MTKLSETVKATCRELEAADLRYTIERTLVPSHYKICVEGLPPIFCSATVSDHRAAAKATSFVRRLLKNPPPRRDSA